MQRDEATEGMYVNIKGYGGFAKILQIIEQDQLSPAGTPMYRVTVEWGAPNNRSGCLGRAKAAAPIEEFPLGRCEPTTDTGDKEHNDMQDAIESASEAELLKMLAQLKEATNA